MSEFIVPALRNPAGQTPHYLVQNYIVKVCDQKDRENKIEDISILKSVFPEDRDERQEIENGLSELSSHLSLLAESVRQIEVLQDSLVRIPKLSSLIVRDIIQGNPIRSILPDDKTVKAFEYSRPQYNRDVKRLDEIETFLAHNPLIQHDASLVRKLKKELELALDNSELESAIRNIILLHQKEIDAAQEVENKEIATKRQQFERLLESIRSYFKFHKQFHQSIEAISRFSIKITTKEIESMGHKLKIDNEFELTKDKFLEVLNSMLKPAYVIARFSVRIPMKSATYYDPKRPPVPGQSGHLLR